MEEKPIEIIVFAHGSSVAEANRQVAALAREVSRRAGCPARCAFLDVAQPDLAAAIAGSVSSGARRIVVVPYFLTMGMHVRDDIPRVVEQQQRLFPNVEILVGQSLEGYAGMADLLVNRAREVLPEIAPR